MILRAIREQVFERGGATNFETIGKDVLETRVVGGRQDMYGGLIFLREGSTHSI